MREKEYTLSEAQRDNIFQESLHDFQRKFEAEEEARSVGERTREDEFRRTTAEMGAIFHKNKRRQEELEPVNPWRILASSPPLSVPTSRNSSPTLVTNTWIRPVSASTDLSDDHAILSLVNPLQSSQFRQTLPAVVPSPYHALAAITSGPHSPLSPTIQPTSTESRDQQEEPLHSLAEQDNPQGNTNESCQVMDEDFYVFFTHSQKQRQETFLKDQDEREHRFRASEIARENRESQRNGTFEQKMVQWSRTSLQMKKSQTWQFHRREGRLRGNIRRSTAFKTAQEHYSQVSDMSLSHITKQAKAEADLEEVWFKCQKGMLLALYKSQANQLADASHRQLTSSYSTMLSTWLLDSIERVMGRLSTYEDRDHEGPERIAGSPAGYEEDLGEEVPKKKRARRTGSMFFTGKTTYKLRRWRTEKADASFGFTPSAMFKAGAFIQGALPIPHITGSINSNTSQWNISEQRRMHREFEESQELRAKAFGESANERDRIHTINEAKRGGEFVKAQQKRKEDFDEAEESRESEFQDAQERREYEFQANQHKREEDFVRDEMERNVQARKAQEDREEQFQLTMSTLQRNCVEANERRLEELEAWGQELMKSREQV
ncbi:hypothetical protein C0989_006118 [Termitomyces sp. Mn162]|nr:hypothetical protein C0989_006118 [Termitomyces sp. Mn162]